MMEDAELLRRYAAEDSEEAFAELVRRHVDLVYSAALRQVGGDVHRAKDVVQAVFVTLAQKAPTLTRHPVLVGWLYTTAQHAAAKAMRAEHRRRAREQEAFAMQEMQSPGAAVDWARVRPVLDVAMRELNERDREALLLRFFARRPFAEIGRTLGSSEDAARMRVERALDKLRASLERRRIASSAAALGAVLMQETLVAAPAGLATSVTATALTSASGAASSSLATAALLIGNSKLILGALAVALLALGLGGAKLTEHRALAAHDAAEIVRSDLSRRTALLARLGRQVTNLEMENTARAARIERERLAQSTPAGASSPKATPTAATWDPVAEGRALMERAPELKRAVLERADAITNFGFLDGLVEMGLTPSQIEEFRILMREGNAISVPFGPHGEMIAFTAGTDMPVHEVERRRRELLDDPTGEKWGELMQREEARRHAVELASSLAFSDTPLTADQARQFMQLLQQNRSSQSGAATRYDWDAVELHARAFLSGSQVAGLASLRSADRTQTASMRQAGWTSKRGIPQ